jgi:membrane protease YdiL (CAAX protease family)
MDGLISIAAVVASLLVAGGVIGVTGRNSVSPGWLLIAGALVFGNDLLLTRAYALLPDVIPAAHWNWQGKVLALGATLAVAALPAFGWRHCGLTLRQAKGSLRSCLAVALIYSLVFLVLALTFPNDQPSGETIAFQLTMPGLEEEPFYRGVLLFALTQAFPGRWRFLGVEWGWGAVLSCVLFGLAHALGVSHGRFSFDPLTMAITALPSFVAVWVRLRSGSVLLPILMHNFGNAVSLFV